MKTRFVLLSFTLSICFALATTAEAYPGAKASDYLQSFEIRSVCTTGILTANVQYLYSQSRVASERGGCPDGAIAEISTNYVPIKDLKVAEKAGFEAMAMGRWKETAFKVAHAIQMTTTAQTGSIRNALTDSDYARYMANLSTMTDTDPVTIDVDFNRHEVADLRSNVSSSHRVEIKIIATCKEKSSGILRGYSRILAPEVSETCPAAYQITFEERLKETKTQTEYYNFYNPKEFRYYMRTTVVQILSRFGNPYFEQVIPDATLKQILLDMTTASAEYPVHVIVHAKAKVILDIHPSISPYAL
ncbi:hypothetical protein BH10BDE1_BH10BDE1_15160 [soil metagenome]